MEDRSETDNNILVKGISQIPYFENDDQLSNNKDFIQKICDVLEIEILNMNDIVFHYGDPGEKFYVVLKGNVDLFLPKTEEEIELEFKKTITQIKQSHIEGIPNLVEMFDSIKKEILNSMSNIFSSTTSLKNNYKMISKEIASSIFDVKESADDNKIDFNKYSYFGQDFILKFKETLVNKNHDQYITIAQSWMIALSTIRYAEDEKNVRNFFSRYNQYNKYIQYGYLKYKKFRSYGPMEHFGELALSTNKKRAGTMVISSNQTQLGSITKWKYKNIFNANIENTNTRLNFFRQYFGLSMLESISKFAYSFQEKKYSYGQKLFIQGELPKEMFIIAEGEIQVDFIIIYTIK